MAEAAGWLVEDVLLWARWWVTAQAGAMQPHRLQVSLKMNSPNSKPLTYHTRAFKKGHILFLVLHFHSAVSDE